jgi:formylglycine-generating enzyme
MIRFTLSLALCAILAAADAHAVTMSWSPVGNPGNSNDGTGYGAVGYSYNIGTYDVTNSQYVEFLNDKDPTGANALGLYNPFSTIFSSETGHGIIFNSAAASGSKYAVAGFSGNAAVSFVSWYSAIRFANWINNGQGSADTETGAYTLGPLASNGTPNGLPLNGSSITRNAGATVFLPSENEWYKAAYYNPNTNSYLQYPTGSNTAPTASPPTSSPNLANYNNRVGIPTDVGRYTGTTSPYGAFDMGGNVYQWNESLIASFRGARGGAFDTDVTKLASSDRESFNPTFFGSEDFGFRLAETPEPSSLVLAALGFIGIAWHLRRR